MKTLAEMLTPRPSVFADTTRDDVLNLTDFAEHRIDGTHFFAENFQTQGMTMLFDIAFKRFLGESDTGVIKLTDAMGGGKTHSMLALGLAARDPALRSRILGDAYAGLGPIRVITFSGRENADFGIWGSLAEQLGKKELFSSYYAPLRAPGESAWIRLLEGERTLILLDELPPYLVNARSITVGNSDLSQVTVTALANLFSALGKAQLANVCLVFSDLNAAYESGSELLQSSFKELDAEAGRTVFELAPVALNSDEVYSILRKRLFEDQKATPGYIQAKNEIAVAYKEAVATARKLGFTAYTGETVYRGVSDGYPFHPAIKDLYARFKENQNFQQTRGLIRLMRQIVRRIWESGQAERACLIDVFDVDLNVPNLMAQIRRIKPSLEEAISHDVAQEGQAIAEIIDRERPGEDGYAQRTARLLLMASLSTVNQAVLGLTEPEIFGYLSAPGVDGTAVKACLEELKAQCWYLKTDNRGRIYFQNTKNMVAEVNSLVDSYTNDEARRELKRILTDNFSPRQRSCYQRLYVLPAVDEIALDSRETALVIFEPYPGNRLHPDLQRFYDGVSLKNRVMFLSGARSVMEKLYLNSKRHKAIQTIAGGMRQAGVPAVDQQYQEAEIQLHKATQALFSTIRETFITLYFPTGAGLDSADFKLEFRDNRFDGEEQILTLLQSLEKYEDLSPEDAFWETLRKKCEKRLFTTREMPYSLICERAATETTWQWYPPEHLDRLRADCLKKDRWREEDGYLVKGPFDQDPTSVHVTQTGYDPETQTFTLQVRGVGGTVYYDIGADPTPASMELADGVFRTRELSLRFACFDLSGLRRPGPPCAFTGRVPLRWGRRLSPSGVLLRLDAHPQYQILYTTDGSEPKENGRPYHGGEVLLPPACRFVRAAALYGGQVMDQRDISIDADGAEGRTSFDRTLPLIYRPAQRAQYPGTSASYEALQALAQIGGVRLRGGLYLYEKARETHYVELTAGLPQTPETLLAAIEFIRTTCFQEPGPVVALDYNELQFQTGEGFAQWIDRQRLDLEQLCREGEIVQ